MLCLVEIRNGTASPKCWMNIHECRMTEVAASHTPTKHKTVNQRAFRFAQSVDFLGPPGSWPSCNGCIGQPTSRRNRQQSVALLGSQKVEPWTWPLGCLDILWVGSDITNLEQNAVPICKKPKKMSGTEGRPTFLLTYVRFPYSILRFSFPKVTSNSHISLGCTAGKMTTDLQVEMVSYKPGDFITPHTPAFCLLSSCTSVVKSFAPVPGGRGSQLIVTPLGAPTWRWNFNGHWKG